MIGKALQVLALLLDGHAPRLREARNPDAEGGLRSMVVLKRVRT